MVLSRSVGFPMNLARRQDRASTDGESERARAYRLNSQVSASSGLPKS